MVKQSAAQGPDTEGRTEEQELPPSETSYDKELQEIQDSFYSIVSDLLTRDASSAVQRTLLAVRARLLMCKVDVNAGHWSVLQVLWQAAHHRVPTPCDHHFPQPPGLGASFRIFPGDCDRVVVRRHGQPRAPLAAY